MKKANLRSILSVLLVLLLVSVLIVSMSACGEKEGQQSSGEKKTAVSKYDSGDGWPELAQPLSWEAINAFPIKSKDMPIADARQLCVDFFRFTKTAVWIPSEDYSAYHDYGNTKQFTMTGSTVYGGLPYISVASGSIYRLMDFMDEETGVVDIKAAGENPKVFGNQCSFGAYWGWGRVINSADYNWTENMVVNSGFLRVGPYTYDDMIVGLGAGNTTTQIIETNGAETMNESYALLKAGDGIVYWTTAGHVVMIATDAEVVRDANGKIDPYQSFVTVIDQGQSWANGVNEAGDKYQYQNRVDGKLTFTQLRNGNYIPFTFAEWTGADPIEDTVTSFSHSGDTITLSQLFNGTVTSNYGLSDIYAYFYDADGNEVCKIANHVPEAGYKELRFYKQGGTVYTWGNPDELKPADGITVKIVAQLATGERPTVWEGKLS